MKKAAYLVPYIDLGQQASEMKKEFMDAFESVLVSGHYILGPEVLAFENEFAKYCQTKFSVGTSNGTSSLILALHSLDLEEGDEVITVPNSFIATAASIALAGAKPVFVDIGQDLNIDPSGIESAITARTKALMPVHLTGRPAKMDEILNTAERHNLIVIEDAAQAVGARLNNKPVGSLGHIGCFSFHPLKNLYAFGDGGIITTNSEIFYEKIRMARNHGLKTRDQCEFWSFNCRLDEVQAALLRVQLSVLNQRIEKKRRLAFHYNDSLRKFVSVPDENPNEYCVYQTYMIQADGRDELRNYLINNGVEALVHYKTPIHIQPAAKELGYTSDDFPQTMKASKRILSLPLYPTMSEEQQDIVIDSISKFYSG